MTSNLMGPAVAETLLSTDELALLTRRGWLTTDPARVRSVLGPYAADAERREQVDLNDVRLANLEAMECVLGRAASLKMNIAQLFTDRVFRGDTWPHAVLLPLDVLAGLERSFDLHTIFPPSTSVQEKSTPVRMLFLLAGKGRLLIGYDGAGTYEHPDAAYTVLGFRDYHVYPFVRMDVTLRGTFPALTRLRAAERPEGPHGAYDAPGPFTLGIEALVVIGPVIKAEVNAAPDQTVRPPAIEWRKDPLGLTDRMRRLGCPLDGRWMD